MPKKYCIHLDSPTRLQLERLISTGTHHARKLQHARILLLSDASEEGPGWTDEKIAEALDTSVLTVERLRRRYVTEGLEEALRVRRAVPGRPPKIDSAAEAHLIALACSSPPEGYVRWTVRLLTDRFVELGAVEEPVSRETVRKTLKKTNFSLTARSTG